MGMFLLLSNFIFTISVFLNNKKISTILKKVVKILDFL